MTNVELRNKIFGYMVKGFYFRYQNREWEIGEKSWGTIYSTEEEALEDGSTILSGKSCMNNPYQLWTGWGQYFDEDFDFLVFEGDDTLENGHDDELVCEFIKEIDRLNKEQVEDFLYEFDDYEDFRQAYINYKFGGII